MSTIVLRSVKGTPLTNQEVDDNFSNLNTDKTQLGGTYSSGTASGVLFLNSSKVLTTGSALTFAGNVLAAPNMSISGVGNYLYFDTTGGGGSNFIQTVNDYDMRLYCGRGSTSYIDVGTNGPVFGIGGSEQMRLTSTGLGIGTSSPSQKLTVSGAANFSRFGINSNPIDTVSTAQSFARFQSTGADFYLGTESSTGGGFFPSSTAYAAILYNANATPMQFYTSGALRATLDTSGNLGLGVTPSAWNNDYKAMQLGSGASLTGRVGSYGFELNANNYRNGGGSYIYLASSYASSYRQDSGAHLWFTAPSGTAGNAISFTQAMTMSMASGQMPHLLLGTTTDSNFSNAGANLVLGSSSGSLSGGITFQRNGTVDTYLYGDSDNLFAIQAVSNGIKFLTANTERARIDSSGNLIQTVNTTAATLATNNTLTFSIVDNSTLRISVRGSDGTTRTATVALT